MTDLPRTPNFDMNNVILTDGSSAAGASSSKQEKHSLNPLSVDEDLKSMVDGLPKVQTNRSFIRWRKQFLRLLESYLAQEGIDRAVSAYQDLSKIMERFSAAVAKVQASLDNGSINKDSVSVKGRNSLNEMNKTMTQAVEELKRFVPSTKSEERQRGYTKFQLGAVAVRDSFKVYGTLLSCCQQSKKMSTESCFLEHADKQLLEMVDYFELNFNRFCDLMSDLGLYEVMLKCQEFCNDDDDGDDDMIIFVDLKTGAIGELFRDDCLERGLLTIVKDKDGKNVIKEAAHDDSTRAELSKLTINYLKAPKGV